MARMSTPTRRISGLLLLIIGLGAPNLLAAEPTPANAEERVDATGVSFVAPTLVKTWLDAGQAVTFLDVRQADEFVAGHIANAINIHYDLAASVADQLSHNQPIVTYCIHSAYRARVAAKTLSERGFTNVFVLEGGIVAWQADGLTIRATDLAQAPKILPKTERCDVKSLDQQQVAEKL
jgi:rhodanese-related sulfurtransferase